MEYRHLGKSGLRVPVLSFGTATFGGKGEFFQAWGSTQVNEAKRLIDICLDGGMNFFDTANGYSAGAAEEILGAALEGKRGRALIATKATIPQGTGPNDGGSSRFHIIEQVEASLRRLKTDHIDLFFMHIQDLTTPIDETLRALDDLVRAGKIRYIGCSNYSGWRLMQALATSDRYGWSRYVAHQVYYSLAGREYEWELMPLGHDQGVGAMIWSPLAGGALTGKIRRGKPAPKDSRLGTIDFIPFDQEKVYTIVDALDEVSRETGKTIAQIALNWLLQRPTVANIVVGARNEEQLKQNLGAVGWNLSPELVAKLDAASGSQPIYPYWHQAGFPGQIPQLITNPTSSCP